MRAVTPQGWEFWRSVLVQALGTVLGGGILALIGIAVGAIHNVSWLAVSIVALSFAIVGVLVQFFIVVKLSYAARRRDD
jgi:hypothetical protein